MRENSFTNDLRNAMNFKKRVFRNCCKFLVVLTERYISDSSAMGIDWVSNNFIIFCIVQRNRSIVASALKGKYSPPTKNSTESLLSHEAAQIYSEEFCFGMI